MKNFNLYITEKLKIDKNTKTTFYKYCPENKTQLTELLHQLYRERGDKADLNDIDVSKITDMSSLFESSEYIFMNFDISGWDVSNVKDMRYMFKNSPLENNLPKWYHE